MAEKKKKLRLEGGQYIRGKDDAEALTIEYCTERAAVCLEEAARSQTPLNQAFIAQAQTWIALAGTLKA